MRLLVILQLNKKLKNSIVKDAKEFITLMS